MEKIIQLFLCLLLAWPSFSQNISVKKAELADGKVNIWFDLKGENYKQVFEITLYGSQDNYQMPLKSVSGDVGQGVRPGDNKKITWNNQQDGIPYSSDFTFNIKGKVVYSPFDELEIVGRNTMKRGKTYRLTWTGGEKNQPVSFQLIKDYRTIYEVTGIENSGEHLFMIPKNIKPGKAYQVKINHDHDPNNMAYSREFKIKPKIPRILYIVPALAAIGGAIYYFVIYEPPADYLPEAPPAPPSDNLF